jgi:tetratricopeptide (TPR) repeat protein
MTPAHRYEHLMAGLARQRHSVAPVTGGGPVTLLVARVIRSGRGAESSGLELEDVGAELPELVQVLVEHRGDPAKAGPGPLMAAFPSAADALRGAVALQRAARSLDPDLALGVALHAGAAGGGGPSEMPALVARHLSGRASPGGILCTNVVVGLLGGRLRFGLTDLGELELEGVPFPVSAFEIDYETRPGAVTRAERIPMVGREAELRRLRGWWAESLDSRGGFGLVGGEPGIGKTRLVEELAERIEREGALVLWGHCYERDGMPYAPISEAIQTLVLATAPDELRDDLGGGGPALTQLVPALRAAIPNLPDAVALQPDEERARLRDAVAQLLIARSGRLPVLLCIDDLQWADSGSIMMLSHLGRFPDHRVLILGTYRPAEVGKDRPFARLLGAVGDKPGGRRLVLEGLPPSGVARLLEALGNQDAVRKEEVDAIATETQGNPFFIREVVRHLREEGKLNRGADGRWAIDEPLNLGIREGVREVIGRRLSRMSDAANRLLSAASAFEAAFQFDVVAAVADLPETEARHALDQAQAARLLQPAEPGAARFAHDLVRHTVYEELKSADRMRLHRHAAEVLELTYGPQPSPVQASQIATQYHHSAALPGAERGVDPALAAATHAEAAGGFDEAAAFLRIALDMLAPGDERRPRLLGRLGITLAWALSFDEGVPCALEAGDAIAAAEGDQAAAEYLAEAAYVGTMAGGTVPSWELARRGLEYAGTHAPLVSFAQRGLTDAAPRDIAWARMLAFDCQRREAEDRRYPGIPVDSPERRESARILRAARLDPLGPSPMEAVFDHRQEALTSTNLLILMNYAGEYAACLPLLETEAKEAEALGRLARAARAYAGMAICQSTLGRLPEADASLHRAQGLSTRLGVPVFPVIYAEDCLAGALGERWEDIAATVGPLLAARDPALTWAEGSLLALAARADAHLGHDRDALDSLALLVPWLERSPAWGVNFIFTACHAAEILWVLQRTDSAEVVERTLREKVIASGFRCGMVDGRLALGRLCAVAGRDDEARQWWEKARDVLQTQQAATLLALVDHDEALMAARRMRSGDAASLRPGLDAARQQFETLGMTGWARRVATLR